LNYSGIEIRIADEDSMIHHPSNFQNLSFTLEEKGRYHVLSSGQIKTGYDQENRNCLRLYPLPENFEPVEECPEEAGTVAANTDKQENTGILWITIPILIAVTLMLIYTVKKHNKKPDWNPQEI